MLYNSNIITQHRHTNNNPSFYIYNSTIKVCGSRTRVSLFSPMELPRGTLIRRPLSSTRHRWIGECLSDHQEQVRQLW